MSRNSTPLAPELDRVYRACQALAANIAEFETVTDPELIDALDAALDGLLLPTPEPGRPGGLPDAFTPTHHFALEPGEGVVLPAGRLRLELCSEEAVALAFEAGRATGDLEHVERPFAFSGGIVPLPALRDVETGEWFYSPDAAEARYSLMHRLERPEVPMTPEQAELLYQIQGCAEVGEGSYHDPVTDSLILALAKAAGVACERPSGVEP